MIRIIEPEVINTCMTQSQAIRHFYKQDVSVVNVANDHITNNWSKYDKFILNWVIFKESDFCHECLSLNGKLDRLLKFPCPCLRHFVDRYESHNNYSCVRWDFTFYENFPVEGIQAMKVKLEDERQARNNAAKLREILRHYDDFVLNWCIQNPQQDFRFECGCLNSARVGGPQGCMLHYEQAQCWSKITFSDYSRNNIVNPDIKDWIGISNKQAMKNRKLRERNLTQDDLNVNLIEILSASNATNSFSLLKVQAKISCSDKKWTS
jgi:hypothetical protein